MSEPIYFIPTKERIAYLTFDDGPYVTHDKPGRATATTDELVDRLGKLRTALGDPELSATFFLNGVGMVRRRHSDAEEQPEDPIATGRRNSARRILEEGHDIANHSFAHRNPWGGEGPEGTPTVDAMIEEIRECERAFGLLGSISDLPGKIRRYLRAPGDPSRFRRNSRPPALPIFGMRAVPEREQRRFDKILNAASQTGNRYVTFNVWAKDERLDHSVQWVYQHVTHVSQAFPDDLDRLSFEDLTDHPVFGIAEGCIILMHHGRKASMDALGDPAGDAGIIPFLYEKGFRVRRLPELEP